MSSRHWLNRGGLSLNSAKTEATIIDIAARRRAEGLNTFEDVANVKRVSHRKTQINSAVQLGRVVRCERAYNSLTTQLISTEVSSLSFTEF
jgi:hypothetical protein